MTRQKPVNVISSLYYYLVEIKTRISVRAVVTRFRTDFTLSTGKRRTLFGYTKRTRYYRNTEMSSREIIGKQFCIWWILMIICFFLTPNIYIWNNSASGRLRYSTGVDYVGYAVVRFNSWRRIERWNF